MEAFLYIYKNLIMKNSVIIALLLLIVMGNIVTAQNQKILEETDRLFSEYSKKHGHQAAFLKYCAEDAVLLKNNLYPIKGIEKIEEFYGNQPDSNLLVWEPLFQEIAQSKDLGYTYGTWKYTILSGDKKGEFSVGCYVTIWKLQNDGSWKFVLDTGTSGLPKK